MSNSIKCWSALDPLPIPIPIPIPEKLGQIVTVKLLTRLSIDLVGHHPI